MGKMSRSIAVRWGVVWCCFACVLMVAAACSRQAVPGGNLTAQVDSGSTDLPPTLTTALLPTNTPVSQKSHSRAPASSPTMTDTPMAPVPTATSSATPTLNPTETDTAAPPPPVPTVTPAQIPAPIGSLASSDSPGPHFISGAVVDTASFSQGFKLTVDDGTGQIILLMWHDLYDDCWDAPYLNLGAQLTVKGDISWYEGQLQIEPAHGGDVKLLAAGSWSPPQYPIGRLGEVVGQRALIAGEIVRAEASGGGVNLFVTDESGEIAAYIWDNVLTRIPGNSALGAPGTRVRISGTVQLYRDNLEIVPSLPYDVEIVP